MMSKLLVLSLAGLLFFSGCIVPSANPSGGNNAPVVTERVTIPNGPGEPTTFCNKDGDPAGNEQCFADALKTCAHAVGVFWKTSDGFPLTFESQGRDVTTGQCKVRVLVDPDSKSQYAGQAANCILDATPATPGVSASAYFDLHSLTASACTGDYRDDFQQNSSA